MSNSNVVSIRLSNNPVLFAAMKQAKLKLIVESTKDNCFVYGSNSTNLIIETDNYIEEHTCKLVEWKVKTEAQCVTETFDRADMRVPALIFILDLMGAE